MLGNHEMILKDGAGFAPGPVGTGFSVDGVKSHGRVEHHGALYPAGGFAIEAWIVPAVVGRAQTLVSAYECGASCDGRSFVALDLDDASKLRFEVRDADNRIQDVTTAAPLTAGRAVHVVAVRDVGALTLALYLDGALAISAPLTAIGRLAAVNDDDDPMVIGGSINTGATAPAQLFAGVIDELSLYDTALTADDAARLYAAGASGKCAP